MTLDELATLAAQPPWNLALAALWILLPILARFLPLAHGRGGEGRGPWPYVYSALIYAASVPGLLAGTVTAYMLLFSRQNLMQVDVFVYALPFISMVVTLTFLRNRIDLDAIPGFDRLSGLIVVIASTFMLVLAIQKTRIWFIFRGSIWTLLILVAGLFALLRWGGARLLR